jgi:hypothetical protein
VFECVPILEVVRGIEWIEKPRFDEFVPGECFGGSDVFFVRKIYASSAAATLKSK